MTTRSYWDHARRHHFRNKQLFFHLLENEDVFDGGERTDVQIERKASIICCNENENDVMGNFCSQELRAKQKKIRATSKLTMDCWEA